MRALLPLLLAPCLAVAALAPAASADPVTPPALAAPGAPAPDLPGEVARTAAELTAGTVRLEEGRAHLAQVRASGVEVRAAAERAADRAVLSRLRLSEMVGAAYRSARPAALGLAALQPEGLGEALRATASLEHVQGRQDDVVREADADRVAAQSLVAEADRLDAEAVEQERVLAQELVALQDAALAAQVRFQAEAAGQDAAVAERATAASRASRSAPAYVPGSGDAACGGGLLGGFANGMIPAAALCPLLGTDGLLLRADAAAAYNRMAAVPGMPCAGSSYRSYAEQVSVYRTKPGLAAVPGTSNHGWGVAVDFACGADSFGTPAYQWLVTNGPTFGWTHPAWAEPGGNRPEPWHWEYTG